jgi:hypothetical protein
MVGKRRVEFDVGWAEADLFGKTIEVGDHLVPEQINVTFPGSEGQPQLELTIDSSSGVSRCTKALLSGPEVRTHDFREVNLETWIELIVPLFMDEIVERGTANGGRAQVKAVIRRADMDAGYTKAAKKELQKARRAARRKVTPELLKRVAATYRSDEARPARAVQTAFMVSPRTAYRYISEARRLGLLEPGEDPRP